MARQLKQLYEFGAFRLDSAERLLLRNGQPLPLTPKAYETLLALVEGSGHVLEKDDLLKRVWPDTFVEEATLAQNVFTLRKVLGDTAEGHQYIETVPKRGYRFVAAVKEVGGPAETSHPGVLEPAVRRRGRRALPLAAVAVVAALLAVAYFARERLGFKHSPPAGRVMLAVLPFENLTGDTEQEYFSDGLTEEMITQLGRMHPERLGVIARTSAMQYKQTKKTIAQIVRELGVDYLLEGSVRRAGDRVRISAQLIQVRDQTHVWAENYERDMRDVLVLQDEVARAITQEIRIKLTPQEQARLTSPRPINPEAYEAYLKGRYFWNKRTEEGYKKAIEYLQRAIEKEPGYAEAYAGLADSYALLGSLNTATLPRKEAMTRATAAALRALESDDTAAEVHTSLAFVKMQYEWDWAGAEVEFRRAILLNPNYPTAHHWYAYYLIAQQRTEEALREIRHAQELDPLSVIINTDVGEVLCYARQYDDAIEQSRKALEIDPDFILAHRVLGWAYEQKHMYTESVTELKKAMSLSGSRSDILGALGHVYAISGQKSAALEVLAELRRSAARNHDISADIAIVYAGVGDKDRAFEWLEKAYQERSAALVLLKVLPLLDPLHSDPRFADLLRRVGLPTLKLSP
jgi:TolB-like protein/DNA-binding winged helix-turn-helix (wHTH) protein/Flp pilus assembly protein TadD